METHLVELSVEVAGARRVELLGEVGDWLSGRVLPADPARPGRFATRLALPVGVYAYKLRVDGRWTLDPGNPRTRREDVHDDSVLVVGGAPEPLLFAPAPPFVHEEDGGGVSVTALLRRGAGEHLEVAWRERDDELDASRGERRVRMERAAREPSHLVFRARLPASSARLELVFHVDGRALAGAPLVWKRPAAADAAPAWWREAVVYTIFVDRFRAATSDEGWGADPGPERGAGGHLDGIRRSLPELVDLGVTVLYLTPIHVGASCHRYDVVDGLRVDPALGGEPALERLVEEAHARGLRIVVDLSLSHAGRGFPPYADVLAHGSASRHAAWFLRGDDGELVHYGKRRDAPLLDLGHPEVADLMVHMAERWIEAGADGLRLDAAAEVPLELARRVRSRVRALRPDALVLGEVVPRHAWRWWTAGAVDAATEFGFREIAVDWLAERRADAERAARRLSALDFARGTPAHTAMRFLSTHDHPRFATLARAASGSGEEARERVALALFLLFAMPGVPALLYGEEVGLVASRPELEPEGVWPDRAPMPWHAGGRDEALRRKVLALSAARRASPALARGSFEVGSAEGDVLVLRRAAGGEVIDVVVAAGAESVVVELDDDTRESIEPLVAVGEVEVRGQAVRLGPRSGLVARRALGAGARRRLSLLQTGNAHVRDEDLVAGLEAARSRPTRVDFAVTERCNLRCRHCITHAPERTKTGTARTLSPWLLDRFRDDLAFVEYAGFVHGGEPLSTPMLYEVLAALRDARAGQPHVAHVLTNGVLLGEAATERLVAGGVTSVSVSLDGATAATNDAIRDGGRFDAIVANVRGAVRLRREQALDLRIGVSTVVLRQNVTELDALVDLCADLGVDWLKLEEGVPASEFAATSLLRLDPAGRDAREPVERALERARAAGLVAVDHTFDRGHLWRCALGPEETRFLADDEHANRSVIHPCRVPWEVACIEPNGDVRLGDFFGPVLGNVADASLAELWNQPPARSERARARAARICGAGPVVCVPTSAPRAR